MSKRVAFYLRVSTAGQTVENQRRDLDKVAQDAGWDVVEIYEDAGISGTKGRDKRPGLARLINDATRHRFDMIASWSGDRLGRSLPDLIGLLSEVKALGIDIYLHKQAIDTSTPFGKLMYHMLGVFGEFEAAMIRDRVNSGIARARAQGTKSGKPHGRPRVSAEKKEKVLAALASGTGIVKTAKDIGVGVGTVQRIKREFVAQ